MKYAKCECHIIIILLLHNNNNIDFYLTDRNWMKYATCECYITIILLLHNNTHIVFFFVIWMTRLALVEHSKIYIYILNVILNKGIRQCWNIRWECFAQNEPTLWLLLHTNVSECDPECILENAKILGGRALWRSCQCSGSWCMLVCILIWFYIYLWLWFWILEIHL